MYVYDRIIIDLKCYYGKLFDMSFVVVRLILVVCFIKFLGFGVVYIF